MEKTTKQQQNFKIFCGRRRRKMTALSEETVYFA